MSVFGGLLSASFCGALRAPQDRRIFRAGMVLLILLRLTGPAARRFMEYPIKTQCQFGLIPALYYGFGHLTRVYTDLLSSGSPVVAAYLIFLLYNSAGERRRSLLQQTQDDLHTGGGASPRFCGLSKVDLKKA